MVTLASARSRYTTSQGGYKQLTLHSVISRKMESMRVSPHNDACNLWGDVGRVGQLRHWTCQKGGLPGWFESKVAAYAAADIGSNVTRAQKRVRLPPFLVPVTHLHLSFPSCCESLHQKSGLVVSENEPALANTHESHRKADDLPEPNKRNQTIGFSSKKSPNVNDFA